MAADASDFFVAEVLSPDELEQPFIIKGNMMAKKINAMVGFQVCKVRFKSPHFYRKIRFKNPHLRYLPQRHEATKINE